MLALGIDVGGTAIKAGLVDSNGRIITEKEVLTRVEEGQEKVIQRICEVALELLEASGTDVKHIRGMGIGIPGFVNHNRGEVLFAPNLKWQLTPLKQILEERLGTVVFLDNDVNAAALGELYYGAGKGFKDLIMLTIGTGVGGALILDGKIYRGSRGLAGEIGHMTLQEDGHQCGCGKKGCLETLTSATAILKRAKADNLPVKETKEVFWLAEQGHSKAKEIVEKAAFYLGLGISNLINTLNPQLVIIGGGVSKAGDILFRPTREAVQKLISPYLEEELQIVPASLGNKAGIIGSSSLVFSKKFDQN